MVSKTKESRPRRSFLGQAPSTRTLPLSRSPRRARLLKPWSGGAGTRVNLRRKTPKRNKSILNLRIAQKFCVSHMAQSPQRAGRRRKMIQHLLSRNKTQNKLKNNNSTTTISMIHNLNETSNNITNNNNIQIVVQSTEITRNNNVRTNMAMTTGPSSSTSILEIIIQCSSQKEVTLTT